MTYREALELVRTEYETKYLAEHCVSIRTGRTLDGCANFIILLYNTGDEVILTDRGHTAEVFDEVPPEKWEDICSRWEGFAFRDYRIVKKFESLKDVDAFVDLLETVADTYCPL